GELLEHGQHREILGIGEKEAAEAAHAGPHAQRRLDLVEVRGHRAAAVTLAHGAVPALLGQLEIAHHRREPPAELLEAAQAGVDAAAAARVGAVEAEAVAQDTDGPQAQRARERKHVFLLALNQIRAGLGVLTRSKRAAERPHAAADAIA